MAARAAIPGLTAVPAPAPAPEQPLGRSAGIRRASAPDWEPRRGRWGCPDQGGELGQSYSPGHLLYRAPPFDTSDGLLRLAGRLPPTATTFSCDGLTVATLSC